MFIVSKIIQKKKKSELNFNVNKKITKLKDTII